MVQPTVLAPHPVPPPTRNGAAARVGSSAIRDLLRLTERPGILSLAGGLPAAETFPAERIAKATAHVLRTDPAAALQYSPTEGYEPLRAWIAARRAATPDEIVITHGSQQALDLVVRATVDPGDPVVVADPAYVGALQLFRLAGAELVAVPSDADGLDVDDLADRLTRGLRPRLVYVVADFHNPTGATLPAARRQRLAELADRYGFLIVDDDPYGELRWGGPTLPPLRSCSDRVVTLGSFSKLLCPGLRAGYVVAPPDLRHDLVVIKQAADLHTSTLTQRVIHDIVARPGWLDAHIADLRPRYRDRAVALSDALDAAFGDRLEVSRADGGMFLWARVHTDGSTSRPSGGDADRSAAPGRAGSIDTAARLPRALDHGVAYVPGAAFAVDRDLRSSLRLSFASLEPDLAEAAATRLAAALLGPD